MGTDAQDKNSSELSVFRSGGGAMNLAFCVNFVTIGLNF
jgi:hypothetical protein